MQEEFDVDKTAQASNSVIVGHLESFAILSRNGTGLDF
jgi:hypothetical protein